MDFKDWPKPPAPGSFDGLVYVETGDPVTDAANRLQIFNVTWAIPQRVQMGVQLDEHRAPSITEFLLARIEEDEKYARHVLDLLGPEGDTWRSWAPRRVLADCAAKRAVVERHSDCDDVSYGDASSCPEMRTLTAVYADHPDYQQEWAL